jgi:hypothetical protein
VPTAPFPAVPEQRGGPGEISGSGSIGGPGAIGGSGSVGGPGAIGGPGASADISRPPDRGSVNVSRRTEPFEVVFEPEDHAAPERPAAAGDAVDVGRVDVRWEPLVVRDGCRPERIPAGRWPSDGALVRSEQFAVNEAVAQPDGGVFALHAPSGSGVAEVYGDLVAAIITERARRIADLPGPAAAFGEVRPWSTHRVAEPNPTLTGFEIVLAAPESSALTAHGLPPIGARWRAAATSIDYFASTARLADGVGAWAMLAARLGDGAANRAFAERWWRGAVRGTDVLFPAGESMAAALRRLQAGGAAVDWQGAVARFRSALAKNEKLAAERTEVAVAVTRISDLEQACEEASCSAEAAQARLAELAVREPSVRGVLDDAEEEQRALLAELGALQLDRPVFTTVTEDGKTALRSRSALSVAMAGGVRRGRNWRAWTARRRELRAACGEAELRREAAAKDLQTLSASLAVAWTAVNDETAKVTRLTAEIGPLAEAVALARQRWGDHVPDGPAQAETEDAALIEWRETSAPWADEEYAASRAEVFLAALDLHKTLIAARADVFAGNLGALMDLLCADPAPVPAKAVAERPAADPAQGLPEGPAAVPEQVGAEDPAADSSAAAIAAAWQSLFLVVPVVHMPFGAIEPLFAGLGPTPLGWLLADHAEQLPGEQAGGILGLINRAVLAGDTAASGETALADERGIRADGGVPADGGVTADGGIRADGGAGGDDGVTANGDVKANGDVPAKGDVPAVGDAPADDDVNNHDAQARPGAFDRTGDVSGVSAQWIAERTARYGTWLPAGRSGSAAPDETAEAAGHAARRVWVGTPLRVVRGLDRATIDLRNSLAYDGLLVSDRDLAVRRSAAHGRAAERSSGAPRPWPPRRRPRRRGQCPEPPSARRGAAAEPGRRSGGRRQPRRPRPPLAAARQ